MTQTSVFLDLPPDDGSRYKVLSIKEEYASKIRARTKKWELRTYAPGVKPGGWLALYESRPVQAISTAVQIGRTFKLHPDDAWAEFSDSMGVEFEFFFSYYRKKEFAFGMEVVDVKEFEPMPLAELRQSSGFAVPQMCMYLPSTSSIHKRIQVATAW